MSSDMTNEEERTVFVRNLDEKVTKEILEELFIQMGNVSSVAIKDSRGPMQNSTNKNRFAFIEFQDPESVLFAVEMLDDIELCGRNIVVVPRDRTQQAEQYRKLRDQFMVTRIRHNPNIPQSNHFAPAQWQFLPPAKRFIPPPRQYIPPPRLFVPPPYQFYQPPNQFFAPPNQVTQPIIRKRR